MAGIVPSNRRNSVFSTGFDDLYNALDDFFFNDNWRNNRISSIGSFKIDIQENDNEYVVEAKLPGVKKEEIGIDLDEGRLNISVAREENVNEEKKNYVYRETKHSSMNRSIYLENAKSDGVKAKLDNGVLYIKVPKQEKPNTSRKIEIE
jgi:HSP20 family protein